jgi:hypothetical protein
LGDVYVYRRTENKIICKGFTYKYGKKKWIGSEWLRTHYSDRFF